MKRRKDISRQPSNAQRRYQYRGQKKTSPATIALIFLICIVGVVFQVIWVQDNQSAFMDKSVLSFFRQTFRSQINKVPCHHCGGAGLVTRPLQNDPALCSVCFGLGEREIRRLNKKADLMCHVCLGMGRVEYDDHAATCTTCAGRGVITDTPRDAWEDVQVKKITIQCDTCAGNGLLRSTSTDELSVCPICFGMGNHTVGFTDPDVNRCIACTGMGRLVDTKTGEARTCRRCNGRGLIDPPEQSADRTQQF